MHAAGQAALGVGAVLVVAFAFRSTMGVNRERAAVLAGLVGVNIMIGVSPMAHGAAVPCDAVIESIDALRTVQFASLTVAGDRALPSAWIATVDDASWLWLVQIRWVETHDGTRWTW